jgi:hypothetical protein
MEENYTKCQHSTSFVLNGPKQFFSVSQYKKRLSSQAADFFGAGVQKLISPYDKCLIPGGDNVETLT